MASETAEKLMRALAGVNKTAKIFYDNYNDMNDANTYYSDKYFHSKANCQSAQNNGWGMASVLDIAKELNDLKEKNHTNKNGKKYEENLSDSLLDLEADLYGYLQGATHPFTDCRGLVGKYRPNGLNEKY